MTRIGHQNLTSGKLTGTISYDRTLEYLVMYNNNPVPLYVRLGSPEIPNQFNYDIAVPPNYIMAISVNSQQFGFRLGASNVVVSQVTGTTVVEATIDEQPPSLGGVPINNASLSTADFLNGIPAFTGPTVYGPFNINQWGGIIINVIPSTTSGQGVIQVDISPDGTTFTAYQTWTFWQNIPATILVPRVSQFVRVTLNATAIVGEPVIGGVIGIRGSLTEITTPSYTPQGQSIVKSYALAASGAQQYQFVTTGLPAISLAAIATAGTGASAAITLLVEASSNLVDWRQVTYRTQRMSIGVTLYRALGQLDLFMRVTVFEISGISVANGNIYLSVPKEPDLGGILNTIQQSLGDVATPINSRQDIYHELDAIFLQEVSANTNLSNINTTLTTTIHNDLTTIHNDLTTINTSIGGVTSAVNTVNTSVNGVISAVNNVTVALATSNVYLNNIATNTGALAAPLTRGMSANNATIAGILANNVWVLVGIILVPTWYLTSMHGGLEATGIAPGTYAGTLQLGIGTNAAVAVSLYATAWSFKVEAVSGNGAASGPVIQFDSLRSAGLSIQAGWNSVWALPSASGGIANFNRIVTSITQTP